jgi:hypothetical protein
MQLSKNWKNIRHKSNKLARIVGFSGLILSQLFAHSSVNINGEKMPDFLVGEECERCKGPLIAEAFTTQDYDEKSWTYVSITVWPCYACGHKNKLDSQPILWP